MLGNGEDAGWWRRVAGLSHVAFSFHSTLQVSSFLRAGSQVRQLLSLKNAAVQKAVLQAKQGPRWDPSVSARALPEGWSEVAAHHCACIGHMQAEEFVEAYDSQVNSMQAFTRVRSKVGGVSTFAREQVHQVTIRGVCCARAQVFREEAESWVVEVMHGMVANLQRCEIEGSPRTCLGKETIAAASAVPQRACRAAQEADASQLKAGKRGGKLGDCADQLRKGFAVSLQASGGSAEGSPSRGARNSNCLLTTPGQRCRRQSR